MSEEERQGKNSVFSAQPAQQITTHQAVQPQQRVSTEISMEVPVEIVPLPSQGKVYGQDHPLYLADRVEITSMTAREEDILTSAAIIKKGTVITELIRSCLVDKRIDPESLLTGDRNALMVAIRATGYGIEYDGEVACEECGKTTTRTFNLAQLPIRRLTIEPVTPGENLFEFKLPRTKKIVHFRFVTGKVESEMSIVNEKQKKIYNSQKDTHVTTGLLYSIASVDGVSDRAQISKFVAHMPAADSQALRKYMRDNEPGIVMKQESECTACSHVDEVVMPLSHTFLWPNAAG